MSRVPGRCARVSLAALLVLGVVAGCSPSKPDAGAASPAASSGPATVPPTALASTVSEADAWAKDLQRLDELVRLKHVSPFTIHSEAEWKAKLAEIGPKVADAPIDQQFALVSSLVGLLDTHSGIFRHTGFQPYEVLFYKFSDGWFTIAAKDESLIGSRLISIGGHPVDEVESTLRPLIPHDNEMGFLDSVQGAFSYPEYLHGSGLVADRTKPQYLLERPDGSRVTVDFPTTDEGTWAEEFHILGDLVGSAPEAVARRGELAWTRIDAPHKVFLVSVNDYGDMTAAGDAMTAALDAGKADRVVLDIRYLRGGSGDFRILDTIRNDPRINRKGALTVLMGRENVSIATDVDYEFDVTTDALLVGEPTPARADNFRCDCYDIELDHSGIVVSVPTTMTHNGDERPEVAPDIPMALRSADFFAGRDPVLDAAIEGLP